MKGDLHIHTNISDGSYSAKEVLEMAKKNELTHIGITNHDTVKGLSEAVEMGKEFGIKVIPGIEISAYDFKNNRKVHILGYNFELKGANISKLCNPTLEARNENSMWQMRTLIENGYDIDVKSVQEKSKVGGVLYKQHIMQALIEKDYTTSIYSDLYKKLFKNNGICAHDIEYVDAKDAVRAIKDDGGLAVLAHPGQLNSYDLIPELVSNGLDGIEVNHISHNDEDVKKVIEFSQIYGLILTGGSDFHGTYGEEDINIGQILSPREALNLF